MKNTTDYIELNKLSDLHNNNTIFFCKTDYLLQDFEYISKLNHDVVLISGNSDYAITDTLINLAPPNIKKWFAQNAVSYNSKLEPIPMGLENKLPSSRDGHGIGYFDRASTKEKLLLSISDNTIKPSKFIYANFNIHTNLTYRQPIKEISQQQPYIDWEEPRLSLQALFSKILEYKMVLCPVGNGIDTHRLWEVLYCGRIPIILQIGSYKIYELYKKLPIIILQNIEELKNKQYLDSEYNRIKKNKISTSLLDTSFWKTRIASYIK